MEEELMFKIKDDLIELNNKGFNIENISIHSGSEMNTIVSYNYAGRKFAIENYVIGRE